MFLWHARQLRSLPWRAPQNYLVDWYSLGLVSLDDGALVFDSPGGPQRAVGDTLTHWGYWMGSLLLLLLAAVVVTKAPIGLLG